MTGQAERPEEDAPELESEVPTGEGPPKEAEATEAKPGAAGEQASEEMDPLAELQAKADEHWERYMRASAEVENVRKRAARDVENAHKFALERFGKDLLAVKDSLEMGLAAESADATSLREGSEATLKMLATTLERFGIVEINPLGEPFDPEFHEAMTVQPAPDAEPGSVLTVIQKGYTLNGRLLRPAMVVVVAEA